MDNAKFTTAINRTLAHEGSYSNLPADRGGETWKGISRNAHPNWPGWDIVDHIKSRTAKNNLVQALRNDAELEFYVTDFYYSTFYEPMHLDEFDLPLAVELFDVAVNQGKSTSAKFLQLALNHLNNNEKYYNDIATDGIIGSETIKAYRAYMQTAYLSGRSAERNMGTLVKCINGLQFGRYAEIVKNDPAQEVFFYGWVNRV